MVKKIILCVGIPGSGKSFMAKQIAQKHREQVSDYIGYCSADFYWERPDGLYDWNPKHIGRAHAWCQEKCKWYMLEEYDLIIVDNTSLTEIERKPYRLLAEKFGYEVEIREPATEWRYDAVECSKRNTHGVPLETCKKMLEKLQNGS